MKTSNIFLLIALIPILGSFLGSTLMGQYVSKQQYDQNLVESIKSLETHTYNHKTEIFDQPFDRIVIRNTQPNLRVYENFGTYTRTNTYNEIRWIQSEKCGLKAPDHNDFIEHSFIENNTLVIYTAYPNKFTGGTTTLYSPSLTHIAIENIGTVRLANTVADSLSITATRSHFEIGGTSAFEKLDIQANEQSAVSVEARHVGEARYTLSASNIRSRIDSCVALYIQGDSLSYAEIAPYLEKDYPSQNTLQYLRFNSELMGLHIEGTRIVQIDGNKANLSLNMSAQQVQETLAVVNAN
ncbi:hypothetical protein [Parapedobacter sp.]